MDINVLSKIPSDWWKSAVLYQIYPRSFYDADNNGIGDLAGVTQKLDYLNDGKGGGLGVDAIWLSPFFKSPMKDFGYDVSDFYDIDPIFGTMKDLDKMVESAHRRGIKILVDLVLNHCSDQHPWFWESKKDRSNPKADWFVWKEKGADGNPPNNWLGVFGGSAWEYDFNRDQYYLHSFLKEQPDLNWYNEEVREAIRDIIRFWTKKGIDGFRLDTVNYYAYDQELRDNPKLPKDHQSIENREGVDYDQYEACFSKDRPENFDCLKLIRTTINENSSHVTTVGEIGGIQKLDQLIKLASSYVTGGQHLHMAYTFSMLRAKIDAASFSHILDLTEKYIGDGWPCWSMGNHDCTRVRSRSETQKGIDWFHENLMLLLLCLRGTPIIYYGDELGMREYAIKKDELRDPFGITYWPGYVGRDGCRTPFPWSHGKHAQGFNESAKPWLPANSDVSLDQQEKISDSMFALTKEMIKIRKKHMALAIGDFRKIQTEGNMLAFQRKHKKEVIKVVCNFGELPKVLEIDSKHWQPMPIRSFQRNGSLSENGLEIPAHGFSMVVEK